MSAADETYTHTEFAAGLRELADFIERTPEFPLPYSPKLYAFSRHYADGSGVEEAARIARLFGRCEKSVDENTARFELTRRFGPVGLVFTVARGAVCERREVTKTVVEWVCAPSLLAAADAQAVAP